MWARVVFLLAAVAALVRAEEPFGSAAMPFHQTLDGELIFLTSTGSASLVGLEICTEATATSIDGHVATIDTNAATTASNTGSMDTKLTSIDTSTDATKTSVASIDTNMAATATSADSIDTNTAAIDTKAGTMVTSLGSIDTNTGSIDTATTTTATKTTLLADTVAVAGTVGTVGTTKAIFVQPVGGSEPFPITYVPTGINLVTPGPNLHGTDAAPDTKLSITTGAFTSSVDTNGVSSCAIFGNADAATTLTLYVSHDESLWFATKLDVSTAGDEDFYLDFACPARYYKLKSSATTVGLLAYLQGTA